MRLTIDFKTAEEFKKKLETLAQFVGVTLENGGDQRQMPLPLSEPSPSPSAPGGSKRGRPRKDASVALKEEPSPAEEEAEEKSEHSISDIKAAGEKTTPAKPTFDDVKTALKKVSASKGIEKCQDLLKQFEAERISALKEEHYPKFIKACDIALG